MLKELLKKSVKSSKSDNVAVLLSGGIDSCVILNLLMDKKLEIEPYTLKMNDIDSD
ncbi:MAG: asparagine synthase-related protein, partial [Flammeovirgaceae bacterium]